MATQRLNLTRDQLATFLKDFEQIKQFEKLFATVDAIAPDFVNEVFTLAANADAKAMRIGTTTSHVIVDQEGIYNFQTSIQLDSTVATDEEFYLWFRLNGVDVTNSASQVRVKGNDAEVFLALNYFFNLKPNDYVELMFSVTNLGVRLLASGAVAPHPGIPSVILTVSNNIQGVQ